MRVLVSNDDGVDAPGIRILAEGLRDAGHDVTVVAPDRDRSGASNSLTLDPPMRVRAMDDGTLAACRHADRLRAPGAHRHARRTNPTSSSPASTTRANLGDDVIYSGTVAAAMEGRFLGLPAVAMSLATADHDGKHYETAARAAVEIIARLRDRSAAGRHHPQRQRARPAVGRRARLRGHAPGQPPSRRTVHAAAGSARPPDGGGSAPPAPNRTPAPAPISTPCAAATSRSRRSTSTSRATRRWNRSRAGSAAWPLRCRSDRA